MFHPMLKETGADDVCIEKKMDFSVCGADLGFEVTIMNEQQCSSTLW